MMSNGSKLARYYDNLSVMLDAGLPIVRALQSASRGFSGSFFRVLQEIPLEVQSGRSLSEAMAVNPKIFKNLDRTIIETGERGGSLPECLKDLARWYGFQEKIKKVIVSKLALSVLLIHAVAVISPFPSFILGRITGFEFIIQALGTVLLFYIPLIVYNLVLKYTPQEGLMRQVLDTFMIKLPMFGKAIYQMSISRYSRAFHILLKAGVPVAECAKRSSMQSGNMFFKQLVERGEIAVLSGNPVSEGFSKRLPADFLDMWRIGEETGELDNVLKRLADNYLERAEIRFEAAGIWFSRFVYALVCLLMLIRIFTLFGSIVASYSM